MENYSYQSTKAEKKNYLLFWKHHSKDYPHLAVLAKEYLCVAVSSVLGLVGSIFSATGLMLNSRKSSLDPMILNYRYYK